MARPKKKEHENGDDSKSISSERMKAIKYTYSRSNSKIITPSKEAFAVSADSKSTQTDILDAHDSQNKPVIDLTDFKSRKLQHTAKKINEISVKFKQLTEKVNQMSSGYGYCGMPFETTVDPNSAEQTLLIAPNLTADDGTQGSSRETNQYLDESNQIDKSISANEEFNRSNDNVLISNKYNKVSSSESNRYLDESNNNDNKISVNGEFNRSDDNVLITNQYNKVSSSESNQFLDESNKNDNKIRANGEFNRSDDNVLITNQYNKVSSSESNQFLDESNKNDNKIRANGEFNRSDDNVLITNKCNTENGKTMQENDAVQQEWVPIGHGMTKIRKEEYEKINWKSYSTATRTLLRALFSREVLATHSLTGKSSPAFQDKPAKMSLDQHKISAVIIEVSNRFKVGDNLIRSVITTKCADECKMWKTRCKKKLSTNKENTEN